MVDVAIIGLGITGAACARELSRYHLRVLGLEAQNDFAAGATRANSGIVHAGYDAKPGTNKAKYNVRGNALYPLWAKELEFPFIQNGSLIVCHDDGDLPGLQALYDRGVQNGVPDMELLDENALHSLEPNLSPACRGALYAKTGGITCPYEFCIACGENARENGAEFIFNAPVTQIRREDGGFAITAGEKIYRARTILNAAGLYSDAIHNLLSRVPYRIQPRRGEYQLMDNAAGAFFTRTIFTLPTPMGKGVLISPTVDGNLYLGPTSLDSTDKEDTSTTAEGRAFILKKAAESWDNFPKNRFITGFTGLRAHLIEGGDDFIVGPAPDVPGLFDAVGIESPGLTSAPAIAEDLSRQIAAYCGAKKKDNFQPHRPAIRSFRTMTNEQRRQAIAENPLYGHIICRCEQVSEAEVLEAIRRGARTVDGVKRRTRAGMGKCQGGFCGPVILEILARELGCDPTEILKDAPGSNILVGPIR